MLLVKRNNLNIGANKRLFHFLTIVTVFNSSFVLCHVIAKGVFSINIEKIQADQHIRVA